MQEELGCSLYLPHFVYGMSKLYKVLFKYCLCKFGYLEARYPLGPGEGGGVHLEKLGGVCGPLPKTLTLFDQNLRYSLSFLSPDHKFETLFMT